MPALKVKKVVAVCFLEAVKMTLDQLGVHRLELSERGAVSPVELTRAYADGRRLRDYLQRCLTGFHDEVELDLVDADRTVLVACCRHFVEASEARLEAGKLAADEADWLDKKIQVLSHWALEIAAKPLLELPLKRRTTLGKRARALAAQINDKLFGSAMKVLAQRPGEESARPNPNSTMVGLPSFGEMFGAPELGGDDVDDAATAPPAAPPVPAAMPPQAAEKPTAALRLLDPQKLTEPRLRALAMVDLHAFDRAVAAGDWRLATILLASVLEVAVLDHALPRQEELGLVGTPSLWNVQSVLLQALGDAAEPRDEAQTAHLFAARNMLHPAVQMEQPTIVTQVSFERLRDFVQRALHRLGFGGAATAAGPWQAVGGSA
jgi:hypothetical protein